MDESESDLGHVLLFGGHDGRASTLEAHAEAKTRRLGCARRFFLSFLVGDRFARLRGCRTGASFASVKFEAT